MKDVYLPFIRQEGIDITTISIMKFKVMDDMDEKSVLKKFIDVVTQWVSSTEEGKEAWEYSSEDFNVGDLASYEDEIKEAMSKELMANGIHDFEILWGGDSTEIVSFDTILVDSSKLKD